MTRAILIILSALLFTLSAEASVTGTLRGKVTDASTGDPIAGVIVRACGRFTSTDREGRFSIAPSAGCDTITFRLMGYATLKLPLSADLSAVALDPKVTSLEEVIVEAPDIYARGDTLVFNVARYATAKDNAIIDVIKRLPGIKVEKDGTIKYQGKPISRFYLDGNDIIGGQYGMATNNISYKDVKSVEVMENHQPVKALEGIEFPDEAGINLKLKEDARGRWVGVAQGAIGAQPLIADGSVFAMRMARKAQTVFTLKADNTGWNPADEIKEHDIDGMFSSDYASSLWPEYISGGTVSVPLTEARTRDNLSWLADAITAWKSGDTSMRLKLDYSADRLDYSSAVTTDYLDNSIPQFIKRDRLRTQRHDFSARFNSETNKREYFMRDRFTVSGGTDRSNSGISGTMNLSQEVDRNSLSAVNDLKLVKRSGHRLLTLTSRNSFAHTPDRLTVNGEGDALQRISTDELRSTTETRLGHVTRFWKYYLSTGIDIDYHRMYSRLEGRGAYDNHGLHEAFLTRLYATPQTDFERNGWRASLRLPVKWVHHHLKGDHDYADIFPVLTGRRQLTAKSYVSALLSWHLGAPQAWRMTDAPFMSDYRTLLVGGLPGKYSHDVSASLSYSYRNPMKALFASLTASYIHQKSAIIPEQIFSGDLIISTYADRKTGSDFWKLQGDISKGLGHSRMVTGCNVSASLSSAASMRDGAVIPYRQRSLTVAPYFKGSLLRWLSTNYEAEYGYSRLHTAGSSADCHSLHQNLSVTVMPDDRLNFTAGAEHFLTRFPEGNDASLLLLDASAVWHPKNRIRLSLTARNLLDRHAYRYVSYGPLSVSEHSFGIRQRTVVASLQYRF